MLAAIALSMIACSEEVPFKENQIASGGGPVVIGGGKKNDFAAYLQSCKGDPIIYSTKKKQDIYSVTGHYCILEVHHPGGGMGTITGSTVGGKKSDLY